MYLLTLRQWLGPSRRAQNLRHETPTIEPREEIVGLATRLPLGAGLAALREYEVAYTERFWSMAVNFNLVAVSAIDDLDADALENGRVHLVEDLLRNLREDSEGEK